MAHGHHFHGHARAAGAGLRKPVVVWNTSRRCNLKCLHCYTDSENCDYPDELTTAEGRALIDDLAQFGIPALLFSGGEPLLRPDLFDLVQYAVSRGVRPVLSTNGVLITAETAKRLKEIGFIYVGISLDGIGKTHDHFRQTEGAFDAAMRGFRNCLAAGQRVGLRLTLTRQTAHELDRIFDFILDEKIPRACFYHLVPAGRGRALADDPLTIDESRRALDTIVRRTREAVNAGRDLDILTVDNHVDGPYLYLQLLRENPERAAEVRRLLEWNGGGAHSSGVGIGNIDPTGHVHPDQFWQDLDLGSVRERPFSEIWSGVRAGAHAPNHGDATGATGRGERAPGAAGLIPDADGSTDVPLLHPMLAALRDRLPRLKGRCATCGFLKMCGGSFRVRALRRFGDPWAWDPACYLTEEECARGPTP